MTDIVITVDGRRVFTYEQLAPIVGRTPSALRSIASRRNIQPAAHLTKAVPLYTPDQFGKTPEESP